MTGKIELLPKLKRAWQKKKELLRSHSLLYKPFHKAQKEIYRNNGPLLKDEKDFL